MESARKMGKIISCAFSSEEKAIQFLDSDPHLKRVDGTPFPCYNSDMCNEPLCEKENLELYCDSFYVKEVPLDDLNTKLFWDWEECVTKEE